MPTKKTAEKAETKQTTVKKEVSQKVEKKSSETKAEVKKAPAKKVPVKKTTVAAKKDVEVKEETVKKAPAKKAAAKKSTTAKKAEVKEEAVKKAPAKKTTAKKSTTAKKAEAKEEAVKKAPAKKTVAKKSTTAKKAEVKEEVVKKAPAKKAATKKSTTAKKAEAKEEAVKKAPVKKTATKKAITAKKSTDKKQEEKLAQYNNFAIDTCLEMANAMGVSMSYNDYEAMLLDQDDLKVMTKQVLDQYHVDAKAFSFEKDGYDTDLIEVLFQRISETTDIKASDFKAIQKEIDEHVKYEIKDDATVNNEEYQKDFDLVRQVLMIAQRKNLHSTTDIQALIKVNPSDFINKFMDLAYQVLPLFEYDDVKYYENFIYTVLSQFEDLHQKWGTRALMDVADLYIKHGDYGLGDANYNYVLRENDIKDMIYYRFANIYVDIDLDKAKSIANSSFQFVDDRYDYYSKIIEILEK